MKRFTDTDLWGKAWFMELSPAEKAAWFYITAHCDNVGVWSPNTKLAEYVIGEPVDWMGLVERCNGNVHLMDNGKWWLVDFCAFQHPDLHSSSTSKPVQSYIRQLKNHGLWDEKGDAPKGMDTLSIGYKERERDKERERERERERESEKSENESSDFPDYLPMNQTRYARLCEEYGKQAVADYIAKIILWEAAKGESTKDYAARAEQWMLRDNIAKVHRPKICPDCKKQYIGDCCGRCGYEEGKAS